QFFFLFQLSGCRPVIHSFPTRRSSDLHSQLAAIPERFAYPCFPSRDPSSTAAPLTAECASFHVSPNRDRNSNKFRSVCLHSNARSEEHTSELQSRFDLVCRLLLETKTS